MAFLYKSWNYQIPFNFAEIDDLPIQEIEEAAFDLSKGFVFIKMPS